MSAFLSGGINLVVALAILVVLVLVHEIGHFVTARLAGVRVHEFGIGFPPRARVLGSDGETVYTLNWLPLGGFVRLEGEEGESDDPRSFVRQSVWRRTVILAAGVAMNLVLAFVIFVVIAAAFEPLAVTKVVEVQPGSPAASAGLVAGDVITAIDGRDFPFFDNQAPTDVLRQHPGGTVTLTVRHPSGGVTQTPVTLRDEAAIQAGKGALGITALLELQGTAQRSPPQALQVGTARTLDACGLILRTLGDFVVRLAQNPGQAPPIAGPIGVVEAVGTVRTQAPPVVLFWLMGLLSANLAVLNILPIPPLDGGHILVGFVQAITRNRISAGLERAFYLVGFVLIFALIIWVSYFDLLRVGA